MRASYDSRGDTIQIELEPIDRLDRDDDSLDPRVLVGIVGERPVLVELLHASDPFEKPLAVAAERYGLDLEALTAAASSALAAPDRTVTLEVAVRL